MVPVVPEHQSRLPEGLLRAFLDEAHDMATQVADLIGPAHEYRDAARQYLQEKKMIHQYKDVEPQSVCGVDGSFVVEQMMDLDLLACAAVRVNGLTKDNRADPSVSWRQWSCVKSHDMDHERWCRGIMAAQELALLAEQTSDFRILDGSHITPLIHISSALSAGPSMVRKEARKVWENLKTVAALEEVCSNPAVVAMPKYDSGRDIVMSIEDEYGITIPSDDRHLMTLVLEPGERLVTQTVPYTWQTLHFTSGSDEQIDDDLADAFNNAVKPLHDNGILYTYMKPDASSPAYRIECKPDIISDKLDTLCSSIASQIIGPFIQEPFPQYLADVMAKSIGVAVDALKAATQLELSQRGQAHLAAYLSHPYRTEGLHKPDSLRQITLSSHPYRTEGVSHV